ncbi:hypothetical protein UlMin_013701 [Ulmus minor]
MTTIHTLIAVALVRQWHISQLDVKNAFLNGDLQEEVYMTPPSGDDIDGISALKTELARQFKMKDLGSLRYFLGIEVAYSPRYYLLSQSKYVADILEWAILTDNKTVDTPIEVNAKYSSSDSLPLSDPTLYCTIVRSLFVASPTTVHWAAVLRILRYLRGTVFQSLLLPSTSSLELRAYSDTDHDSDPTNHKYVTSFCIFLSDSLISWNSKKQTIISQSSTEAEYRAMTSTTKEIVWLC